MPDIKKPDYREIRCGHCLRLLARAVSVTVLRSKCPRCKTLNHFDVPPSSPA